MKNGFRIKKFPLAIYIFLIPSFFHHVCAKALIRHAAAILYKIESVSNETSCYVDNSHQ